MRPCGACYRPDAEAGPSRPFGRLSHCAETRRIGGLSGNLTRELNNTGLDRARADVDKLDGGLIDMVQHVLGLADGLPINTDDHISEL